MSSVPSWILKKLPGSRVENTSLSPKPYFRKLDIPSFIKYTERAKKIYKKLPIFNQNLKKHVLKPSLYNAKCSNMWRKFDSQLSPGFQKMKPSMNKLPLLTPQLKLYKETTDKKKFRKASVPLEQTESTDEDFIDLGVQCDIRSEISDNEINIHQAKYLHYISLSYA